MRFAARTALAWGDSIFQGCWVGIPTADSTNIAVQTSYVDAKDGFIAAAGAYSAAVFDGISWTHIAGYG